MHLIALMTNLHPVRLSSVFLAAFLFAGCADRPRLEPEQFRSMPMGEASYKTAFATSLNVMREYFSIGRTDDAIGRIEARPEMFNKTEPGTRLSEQHTAEKPYRRTAVLKVRSNEGEIWADIRVQEERRDTRAYRQFSRLRAPDDNFVSTPIDEETATDVEEEEVWTVVRQDRALEREILMRIHDRLAAAAK